MLNYLVIIIFSIIAFIGIYPWVSLIFKFFGHIELRPKLIKYFLVSVAVSGGTYIYILTEESSSEGLADGLENLLSVLFCLLIFLGSGLVSGMMLEKAANRLPKKTSSPDLLDD